MERMKNKKRPLLYSILSMLLCLTMFIGTTLAWFTSTAVNTGNRVKAGSLGVALLKYDFAGEKYVDISDQEGDIFNDEGAIGTLWEPGKTEVVLLQVQNTKELALNYNIVLDIRSEGEMENTLTYAILPDVTAEEYLAYLDEDKITGWASIEAFDGVEKGKVLAGEITAAQNGALKKGESDFFALAVHMDKGAGNTYQGKSVTIDVSVVAKQMASEYDSFGNQYDANASYNESGRYPMYVDALYGIGDMEEGHADPRAGKGQIQAAKWYWTKWVNNKATEDQAVFSTSSGRGQVVQITGNYVVNFDLANYGWNAANGFLDTNVEYVLSMYVMAEDPSKTIPYIQFDAQKDGGSNWINTEVTDLVAGEWKQITIPISESQMGFTDFDLLLGAQKVGNSQTVVYYDDVQIIGKIEEGSLTAKVTAWEEKLAAEEADSQMVTEEIEDPFTWQPPLVEGENLVTNGSFDTLEGWKPFKEGQDDTGTLVNGHDNIGGALRIEMGETSGSTLMWTTDRINVDGGDEYQVSFWYRIPEGMPVSNGNSGPSVWVEYYMVDVPGGSGYISGTGAAPYELAKANGEWQFFSEVMKVPGNAGQIQISPRLLRADSYWMEIDEIVVYKCGTGEEVKLETGETFFYSDMNSTEFSVELNMNYASQIASGKVDFAVYDGSKMIWEEKQVAFSAEGIASKEFSLSNLIKLDSPYCVKATIYAADGTVFKTITKNIYLYNRPEYLSADGLYTKYGEDFYPVIGYHCYAPPAGDFEDDRVKALEEAGINVVQLSYRSTAEEQLARLDELESIGQKALLCLYYDMKPAGHPDNISRTIDIVSNEKIQNHPALFAYCVMDETVLHFGESAEKYLIDSYRLIRQYDNKNLITHMECLTDWYETTAEYCDAFYIDPYGLSNADVYQKVTAAREATHATRPVWALMAAYISSKWVYPTADMARNNNWQALIGGATNVGYYSISDSGNMYTGYTSPDAETAIWETQLPDDPEAGQKLWNGLKEFHEKEKEIAFDHFVYGKGTKLSEDVNLTNGYITYSWVAADGKVYVVVLNTKSSDISVDVPLKNAEGADMGAFTAKIVAGRADAADMTGSGQLTVTLTGNEALLFEIQ